MQAATPAGVLTIADPKRTDAAFLSRNAQAVRRMGGQVQVGGGLNGQGVGFFVSIPLPRSA